MSEAVSNINALLDDKLFQVIGSTPESVAESLMKVDLRNKTAEGVQLFAIAIFAAATNKKTVETFVADGRFAGIRTILTATLAIEGKSNMTAMTLLGHCFLTTDFSKDVTFVKEFRRKMGQDHIWAGDFSSGSMSELQKKILTEKKRTCKEESAKALGSGFLKHVGILKGSMTAAESALFATASTATTAENTQQASGVNIPRQTRATTSERPLKTEEAAQSSKTTGSSARRVSDPIEEPTNVPFKIDNSQTVSVPVDVLDYRRLVINQTEEEIAESVARNGVDEFISKTRKLMETDPTGKRVKEASTIAGQR